MSKLAGGTHAITHLIRTTDPVRELVLRRFPPGDDAASREAIVLAALDGLDGLAPRLLAADPAGRRFGEPATLLTRLPGEASLAPRPTQLGRALARVHATPLDRLAAFPELKPVEQPLVLTHNDFWSGNVLWDGDTLTGVVDWSGARRAPRGFDVSWCRLDLFLLHGAQAADEFLAAYQDAAGVTVPEMAWWDAFALANSRETVETWVPNYRDLGRTDLTATALRDRHTAWAERASEP
ncbi:phosphotransferase family protein [Actinoplanes sp. CA-142083]|uniref:phosphotransferase family protein n=1 Tax=Actinoplanes sp. CA-142083 TaxID=3239903 RepID=UPI003D91DA5D